VVSPEAPQERWGTLFVWYVYFLQLKNGDIYVGSTNDLCRKLGMIARLDAQPNLPLIGDDFRRKHRGNAWT
jgi:hypothetical protein